MVVGGCVKAADGGLRLGEPAQRVSKIIRTNISRGRSGELLLVTVRHEYQQGYRDVLVEEQDLVYRCKCRFPTVETGASGAAEPSHAPWQMAVSLGPDVLFRFSALTSDSQRIHYDRDYTTEVEGFPALVVHGPLIAVLMTEVVRVNSKRAISDFEFCLQHPVFLGDPIRVDATPKGDARFDIVVVSGGGKVHASASGRCG